MPEHDDGKVNMSANYRARPFALPPDVAQDKLLAEETVP